MTTPIAWPFVVMMLLATACIFVWNVYGVKRDKLKFDDILRKDKFEPLLSSHCCSSQFITTYRLIVGIYCFGILMASFILYGPTQPTFYTVWNFTLLTTYFLCLGIMGIYHHFLDKPIPERKHFNNLRCFIWIIYKIECTQVLLVDIMLWTVIYFGITQSQRNQYLINYISFNTHAANCLFIYFDLLINNIPFNNFNFVIFVEYWGIIYIYFQWIQVQWSGTYNYSFLDTSYSSNLIMYIALLIFNLLFYLFAMGISKLRDDKLVPCLETRRKIKGTEVLKEPNQHLTPMDAGKHQHINQVRTETPTPVTAQINDDVLL